MSDAEFDVMDELYFVQLFEHLLDELELDQDEIKRILSRLIEKGWVKCFVKMDEEVFEKDLDFENKYAGYQYLATKQGLLAHNGR